VAQAQAAEEVIAHQQLRIAIPKRFSIPMREIWALQPRFENRQGGRVKRLLTHPRFRAAYDFLLLRGQAGEPGAAELAAWWTKAQSGSFPPVQETRAVEHEPAEEQEGGDSGAPGEAPKKKRRRRGGRRRRKPGNDAGGNDSQP
jgi:poly(A) polymerase